MVGWLLLGGGGGACVRNYSSLNRQFVRSRMMVTEKL